MAISEKGLKMVENLMQTPDLNTLDLDVWRNHTMALVKEVRNQNREIDRLRKEKPQPAS